MKMKFLGWKVFHPSQWGWWRSKAKPLMIPVVASDIAYVLFNDEELAFDVAELVEEMEEEEEDEEVPPPDGDLEDELNELLQELEAEEEDQNQYFDSEVADLVEEHSVAPTVGDLIQNQMKLKG